MEAGLKTRAVIKIKDGKKQEQVMLQLPSNSSTDSLKFKILKVKRRADGESDIEQQLQAFFGEQQKETTNEEKIDEDTQQKRQKTTSVDSLTNQFDFFSLGKPNDLNSQANSSKILTFRKLQVPSAKVGQSEKEDHLSGII